MPDWIDKFSLIPPIHTFKQWKKSIQTFGGAIHEK
jgi:hypothetical protein